MNIWRILEFIYSQTPTRTMKKITVFWTLLKYPYCAMVGLAENFDVNKPSPSTCLLFGRGEKRFADFVN